MTHIPHLILYDFYNNVYSSKFKTINATIKEPETTQKWEMSSRWIVISEAQLSFQTKIVQFDEQSYLF